MTSTALAIATLLFGAVMFATAVHLQAQDVHVVIQQK